MSADKMIPRSPKGQTHLDEPALLPLAVWLAEVSAEAVRDTPPPAADGRASGTKARRRVDSLPSRPADLS